jgi:uncharacterized membrane protein
MSGIEDNMALTITIGILGLGFCLVFLMFCIVGLLYEIGKSLRLISVILNNWKEISKKD